MKCNFQITFEKITLNLLCVCVVLFPINYSLFYSLRPFDIAYLLLFGFFLLTNPYINTKFFTAFVLIMVILFASILNGFFLQGEVLNTDKIIFIYKYFVIFSVPWIVVSTVSTEKKIKKINTLLLTIYLFTCFWVYGYLYLVSSGDMIGNFRASFPFSNDYNYSDAHLYSSYLGFYVVGYLIYLRGYFSHGVVVVSVISVVALLSTVLTGSRTGILIVFIFFIFNLIPKSLSLKFNVNTARLLGLTVIGFFIFVPIFTFLPDALLLGVENLADRAFNFNLTEDASSTNRVEKLYVAIEDMNSAGIILGLGLSNSLIWYDGLLGLLLSQGGLLLLLSIFLFYYLIFYTLFLKSRGGSVKVKKMFRGLALLIVIYLISNIITEYVFVSRGGFPVLLLLSVIYADIKLKLISEQEYLAGKL
jgi:hypothetical protein